MKRFIAIFVLALGVAKPALADFLYTFTISFSTGGTSISGQWQFTEPALLTSPTTVSSFLVNTVTATNASGSALATSACFAPMPGQTCSLSGISTIGPTVQLLFLSPISAVLDNPLPQFTTVGTYTNGSATLAISAISAVPEPASVLLFATAIVALLAVRRRSGY